MPAITPDIAQTEAAIIAMTNAFRASERLAPVNADPVMAIAARAFARYLAASAQFDHNADGRTPSQRAEKAGYNSCRLGENLSLQMDSAGFTPDALAKRAVDGWINSPGHRANLLMAGATDVAVAIERVPDVHPKYVTVQMLGRPQKFAIRFSIANRASRSVSYAIGNRKDEVAPRARVIHTTCESGPLRIGNTAAGQRAIELSPANGATYSIHETAGGGLSVETNLNAGRR